MTAQLVQRIRELLADYTFPAVNEADLQTQVIRVLAADTSLQCDREVIAARGRYDVLVEAAGVVVVLELKVTGSPGAVERQAQRYALTEGVCAVAVVTTSSRLARQLRPGWLGGKPFEVITLRSF